MNVTSIGNRRARIRRREILLSLLPVVLILAVFRVYPIAVALGKSFTNWNGLYRSDYVGFKNYIEFVTDGPFWMILRNTMVLLVNVPLQVFFGIVIALLLYERVPGLADLPRGDLHTADHLRGHHRVPVQDLLRPGGSVQLDSQRRGASWPGHRMVRQQHDRTRRDRVLHRVVQHRLAGHRDPGRPLRHSAVGIRGGDHRRGELLAARVPRRHPDARARAGVFRHRLRRVVPDPALPVPVLHDKGGTRRTRPLRWTT